MREKIEYYLVKSIICFLGILPKKLVYGITHSIAMGFLRFEQRRSSLTRKNLALAFQSKSADEICALAKKSYESLSITLAEIILMLNDRLDIESMVEGKEESLAKLAQLTNASQNGVIFITAHFSNWELLAQFMAKNGYAMIGVGRRGNNGLIEDHITTPFREKYGNTNVHKRYAMVHIIKALKQNQITGMLIDQKAGGGASIPAFFFGHKADTTTSVAMLRLKYKPLVLAVMMPRLPNGKYTLQIVEPPEPKETSIESLTQGYNDVLESIIREYPEQWFWMHNRWRLV